MSDAVGALQHSEGPPLGTLATAWLPCRLVDFERDIACLSEDKLVQKIIAYVQAGSNDPGNILRSLQVWRQKYITAQKASSVDTERIRDICEALRCKARLLFMMNNAQKFIKGQRIQKVSTQQQHEATGAECRSLVSATGPEGRQATRVPQSVDAGYACTCTCVHQLSILAPAL
jgi:hypothetical protein